MYRKVILAFLLVLHYSLAFGAIEAATLPDEQHPLGKAIHHDHHHVHHDHHDQDHNNHVEPDGAAPHESAGDTHDHQHKHGVSIQLNMVVSGLCALDFYKSDSPALTPYRLDHNSLSYAPAVPPPDRL